MHYLDLYSSFPDHTITAAWDCQMTEAAQTPWLGCDIGALNKTVRKLR